jgi:hypothetical protein
MPTTASALMQVHSLLAKMQEGSYCTILGKAYHPNARGMPCPEYPADMNWPLYLSAPPSTSSTGPTCCHNT